MPSVVQDDAAGTYRLQEGVAIADERELRQMVRPEEWCAHESMSNSLALLQHQGVSQQDKLAAMPIDRLRIAAEQLSPPEVFPDFLFAKDSNSGSSKAKTFKAPASKSCSSGGREVHFPAKQVSPLPNVHSCSH